VWPHAHHQPLLTEAEIEAIGVHNLQTNLHLRLQARVPDTALTEAWEQFYRVYAGALVGFARSVGVPHDEIENLVQSVWAEIIVRLRTLSWKSNHSGLRKWFAQLVRRRAIDLARRTKRQATESLPHHEASALATTEHDPAANLERHWDQEVVRMAMAQLQAGVCEENYRIMEMQYFQGKTVAQIARALGMTEDQVNGRQRRMLKTLRGLISFYRGDQFEKAGD